MIIEKIIFGLGFVALMEGLLLALAPQRLESVLEILKQMTLDNRRIIGVVSAIFGAIFIWLANLS